VGAGEGVEGREKKGRDCPLSAFCAEELLGLLTSFGYCSAWGI